MGGDLNLKKSWHPGLMKNQTKVWESQQKALNERKLIDKRKKEIEEEAAQEHLMKLQEAAGGRKVQKRVDWMYSGPSGDGQGVTEEREGYLLGKRSVANLLKDKDTQALAKGAAVGVDIIGNGNANSARDTQKKVLEDPMLIIQKQRLEMQVKAMKAAQKKALQEEKTKKEKGEERKHRHRHHHHSRRDRSRSKSSDERDRRERKHRRSRSPRRRDDRREREDRDDHTARATATATTIVNVRAPLVGERIGTRRMTIVNETLTLTLTLTLTTPSDPPTHPLGRMNLLVATLMTISLAVNTRIVHAGRVLHPQQL
jgi:hypothetical protein